MKRKLTVFFNTCGISGRERVDIYKSCIHNILDQHFNDFRVVVSSCLNSRGVRDEIRHEFGDKISYNFIDSFIPVNISFNHSVMQAVEKIGPADGYLYVDSGIQLAGDLTILQKMYDLHTSGPYGMTAGRTDTDSGLVMWLLTGDVKDISDESRQDLIFKNGNAIVPIGRSLNLHFQIFDHSIFENYNHRILPDIFASHSTEGIFSFINAAIKKKFVVHKDVKVRHFTGMDGGSSGFRPEYTGKPGWQHTIGCAPRTILDLVADPEAKSCGLGYEEVQYVLLHDPKMYDENGFSIHPERLKKFLMNFYLPDTHFRYDLVENTFIP